MALINQTGLIGATLSYATVNITGSEFLTNILILLCLYIIGAMFRVETALIMILVFPVVLVLMAYSSTYLMAGGLLMIYLALLLYYMYPTK